MSYLIKAINNHQQVEIVSVGDDKVCLRVPLHSKQDGVTSNYSKDFIVNKKELKQALG